MWSAPRRLSILVSLVMTMIVSVTCGSGRGAERPPGATPSPAASPTPPPPAPARRATVAAKPQAPPPGLAGLGLVTDPLPMPLPMPAGSGDQAAGVLADRILAGGEDALPAFVAALQASGVAVRGPEDQLVVRPAEPWQGLIVDAWELRTMLAPVMPERTVTLTLSDFADTLRTTIPQLKDAPVAHLLVHDLRHLAQGPDSPRRFWARFVIALGHGLDGPPLMTDADPSTIRVNGLQASLIMRRLSLDFLIRAGADPNPQAASTVSSGQWSLVEPLYAEALPCTMNSTERTIMDVFAQASKWAVSGQRVIGDVGFGGMLGYMDKNGWNGAAQYKEGKGYASELLSLAKFIAMYAALDVKVSMDGAPLVRTKAMRPSSGERKDLTAVVRLNMGNMQYVNCFRVMLNAGGLDFKLPNDGPAKGAQIEWYGLSGFDESAAALHGGPEQIVRFVGDSGSQLQNGGSFTSFNSITKSPVDADGKARVTVEGVGQKDKLAAEVHERTKQARVRVNVALKGADFFSDIKDAASAAPGGPKSLTSLPLEVLYRSKWASAGHYTFDVTDWSDEGKWSGTVTVNTRRVIPLDSKGPMGSLTSRETQALDATLQVTDTLQDASNDGTIAANMKAAVDAHYTIEGSSSGVRFRAGCNDADLTNSGSKWAEGGSGGSEVTIVVVVSDGQAHVGVDSSNFQFPYSGTEESEEQRNDVQGHISMKGATRTCTIYSYSNPSRPLTGTVGIGTIDVAGPVDPKDPTHIHGTTGPKQFGTDTVQTITWDLRRN